jgi:hypothetical protein
MSDSDTWTPGQRCINTTPGLGCGVLWEMVLLGIGFWVAAGISAFFTVYAVRKSKARFFFQDQTILFWIFLTAWQVFEGAITLFDFPWSLITYRLAHEALKHILIFIPMCFVILIVFELLFTYRNPGANAISFFRMFFSLFLVAFVIVGVVLSVVDLHGGNADESLSLWCACTDIILAIFFGLPARSLLEIISYPLVQIEDLRAVTLCKVGIALYVVLFAGRSVWNASHYFRINVVQTWLVNSASAVIYDANHDPVRPTAAARAVTFAFVLLFDMGTSVLAMISVYLFKKQNLLFSENPYFTGMTE